MSDLTDSRRTPAPVANDGASMHDLVTADMAERKAFGLEKYGTLLQTFNGRPALRDAYQEVLDLAVYLRQEIEERRERARHLLDALAGDVHKGIHETGGYCTNIGGSGEEPLCFAVADYLLELGWRPVAATDQQDPEVITAAALLRNLLQPGQVILPSGGYRAALATVLAAIPHPEEAL